MAARLAVLIPRLIALVVICLLATSTLTLAARGKRKEARAAEKTTEPVEILAVPDVRGKAYVFAKGILQDAGFAWRVEGSVQGYAANPVVIQNPAPRTRVVDNGEPTVVLRLELNSSYGQRGLPENESPYDGERIVLASSLKTKKSQQKPAPSTAPVPSPSAGAKTRKPDFVVPGAPPEPAAELPLPERADRLAARLAGKGPTGKLINHWLYQHSWIVTGALFGWQDGAEALRTLIRIDEDLQRRWGVGARSAAVARRALVEVERKAKE